MYMYDNVWLCMTRYDYVIPFMTICDFEWLHDSVRPYMPIYNFVWLYMAIYDFLLIFLTFHDLVLQFVTLCYSGWLCMILSNPLLLCKTPHVKSKMVARGPKNVWRCQKRYLPLGFWVLPLTFAKRSHKKEYLNGESVQFKGKGGSTFSL